MMRLTGIVSLVIAVGALLAGCADSRKMQTQTVLFDESNPPRQMFHVERVADPFPTSAPSEPRAEARGCAANNICLVLQGGPPGGANPTSANKATLLSPAGFFQVPSAESQVRLFVAVRGSRQLRIEMHAKAKAGRQIFTVTLPAEASWQEVVLPIDRDKFSPGAIVNDITVFQLGPDIPSQLYIRAATLRTY